MREKTRLTSHGLQRRQRLDAILAESPSFLLSQEEDKGDSANRGNACNAARLGNLPSTLQLTHQWKNDQLLELGIKVIKRWVKGFTQD